jgi:hypothetical protein
METLLRKQTKTKQNQNQAWVADLNQNTKKAVNRIL